MAAFSAIISLNTCFVPFLLSPFFLRLITNMLKLLSVFNMSLTLFYIFLYIFSLCFILDNSFLIFKFTNSLCRYIDPSSQLLLLNLVLFSSIIPICFLFKYDMFYCRVSSSLPTLLLFSFISLNIVSIDF